LTFDGLHSIILVRDNGSKLLEVLLQALDAFSLSLLSRAMAVLRKADEDWLIRQRGCIPQIF
jgi:hypothetical protein